MFNVNSNEYQIIFILVFFNKHYSNFFLNGNSTYLDTDKNISDFQNFLKKIISIKDDSNNTILFLKSNYRKNMFLNKIIDSYMIHIIEILKYEYISEMINKFYIDNSLTMNDAFKLFKIHLADSFKKDSVEIKNINISINVHNEFNKFYIGECNNFRKIINDYYELKFNNMKSLFDIFIKTKEFKNYCKNFLHFLEYIITPNFQKSV